MAFESPIAQRIFWEGYVSASNTMIQMSGNPGQATIVDKYLLPEFKIKVDRAFETENFVEDFSHTHAEAVSIIRLDGITIMNSAIQRALAAEFASNVIGSIF
jgi:hypothetical protein